MRSRFNSRLLAVILCAAMLMISFSACRSTSGSGSTTAATTTTRAATTSGTGTTEQTQIDPYAERIKIKIVSRELRQGDLPIVDDDKVIEYLEDKFNMDMELIYIPDPAQTLVYERLNMMIAAGDIPDLMESRTDSPLPFDQHYSLAKEGLLVDIGEFVQQDPERYPNIKARIEDPAAYPYKLHEFDKIYQVPRLLGLTPHVWTIRQDWLDSLNLKMPETLFELRDVLKAFKENDPDGNNASGMTLMNKWWLNYFYTGFTGAYVYKYDNGEYLSMWNLPEQKEAVKFVRELYKDGLIDNEIFIHAAPDARTKFSSGRAGVTITPVLFFNAMYANLKGYKDSAKLSLMPVDIKGPNSGTRFLQNKFFGGMAVYKNTKDPARILDLLEFLLSDEGQDLAEFGVEGIHFTKDANGNMFKNVELFEHELWGLKGLAFSHGITRLVDASITVSEDAFDDQYQVIKNFFTELGEKESTLPVNPIDRIYLKVQQEVGSKVNDVIDKYEVGFITGEYDIDSEWDKFLAELANAGMNLMQAEANERFKR